MKLTTEESNQLCTPHEEHIEACTSVGMQLKCTWTAALIGGASECVIMQEWHTCQLCQDNIELMPILHLQHKVETQQSLQPLSMHCGNPNMYTPCTAAAQAVSTPSMAPTWSAKPALLLVECPATYRYSELR